MQIIRTEKLHIDTKQRYQTVDGFGVNINAKLYNQGELRPVVDYLIDDLGATLFRMDTYGNANWIDPNNTLTPSEALSRAHLDRIYQTPPFQSGLALARHLNIRGIEPYLTISGTVPAWMCTDDGKTLLRYDFYAEMVADYVQWMRHSGIQFRLLSPLNETDFGPPEGPALDPNGFRLACRAVLAALDARGMQDVSLVVAEQGDHRTPFAASVLTDAILQPRIAVFGMHNYWDLSMQQQVAYQKETAPQAHFWMTEFGDLSQIPQQEDSIAWRIFQRLCRLLQDGMQGALVWDAFDNYHDHDQQWTCYGILHTGLSLYNPKKRYYALKHVFRYVRPGFVRIGAMCSAPEIPVLAFSDTTGQQLTLVGCNPTNEGIFLDFDLQLSGSAVAQYHAFDVYRTAAYEDCARVSTHTIRLDNRDCSGMHFTALPHSIFAVTNVQ